jgi:hypothetical protein
MGLITKLKSRHKDDKSTFFAMRRSKPTANNSTNPRNDSPKKLNHSLSQLTIISIPKEYREEERFNWLTNELDSFQYQPTDSVKATRRKAATTTKDEPTNDCSVSDWLFPCWGSSIETDVKTTARTSLESADETSYSSGSTSQPPDDKKGKVWEAQPEDDVSDVTSTPSEDCTEDSDESCDSSSSPPGPIIGLDVDDALSLSSSEP